MNTRKTLCALALSLALAAPSWAQITFGSWGRVVITPISFTNSESNGETYSAVSAATSTWGDVPYISFSANGRAPSGNIGFNIDFDFGFNVLSNSYQIVGDNAKLWLHPLGLVLPDHKDTLKLVAGRFNEDELRGRIGATEFGGWVLPNGSKDEDNIFTRFKATAGAYARVAPLSWWDSPLNGLTLHAVIGSNSIGANGNSLRAPRNLYNNEANRTNGHASSYNEDYDDGHDGDRLTSALDVYRAGQYALGYRIPEVGLLRFQYIGSNLEVWRMDSYGTRNAPIDTPRRLVIGVDRGNRGDSLEMAFLFDMIEGLRLDAGLKIFLEYETTQSVNITPSIFNSKLGQQIPGWAPGRKNATLAVQNPTVVALGANWTPSFFPALNIIARFDGSFGGKIETVGGEAADRGYIEYGDVISMWLVPSYKVSNLVSAGLDLGFEVSTGDKAMVQNQDRPEYTDISTYSDFGFSPWADIQIGGGRMRAGVVVMFPGSFRYKADGTGGRVTPQYMGDPIVSLPISITYSF